MSMLRDEAIKVLENGGWWDSLDDNISDADMNPLQDAIDLALTALRGPTREMVERMRGEWEVVPRIGVYDTACSKCGYAPGIRFFSSDFCPACGAPMTDKAVEMVMERLNKREETKK